MWVFFLLAQVEDLVHELVVFLYHLYFLLFFALLFKFVDLFDKEFLLGLFAFVELSEEEFEDDFVAFFVFLFVKVRVEGDVGGHGESLTDL